MGFFGGSQPQQVQAPQYTGVQIQTSSNALPIPVVYGTNVIAPNIIYAGAFQARPIYSGGKKPTVTGFNYTQNLIFGLCEGAAPRIGLCFQDSDIFTTSDIGGGVNFATGATPPALPTGPSFVTAAKAMAYAGTAYASAFEFNLGVGASTGSINFEMHGILDATAGINGFDADPALALVDILTSTAYGLGLPSSALDLTTILSPASGANSSYQGYCKATGLGLSPALVNSEKANSILTRWLQLTNAAPVWSGGKLKIIPYGDTIVTTAPRAGTLTQAVPAIDGNTTDGPSAPYILVNAGFVANGGVVYAGTNAPLTLGTNPATLSKGKYYLSPIIAGRYVFSTADVNTQVTIAFTYAPLASFTPNLVPVYDLTDDDFLDDGSGVDPVVVSRVDPSQLANVVRLEISDRNNFYSATTIEARDQNAIERYGYRLGSTITAHEITNAQSAQIVAQLILQRGLGIRNTYAFRLSWEFVLLEPMDVVTLTDAALGLSRTPVRITGIEEDEQGMLAVKAEEIVAGLGTAVAYGTIGASGSNLGTTAAPAPVVPLIFEAPSQISNNAITIVFGVSSSISGQADPNYGGCNIFVSTDGSNYQQATSFMGQSTIGVLSAALPAFAGSNPDNVDTLAVNLAQSGTAVDAGTQAQAQGFQTLALVGNELVAYGAASGTPGGAYALTYLERGVYGSGAPAHAAGSSFFYLEGLTATAVLPNSAKGTTVYFKFQTYNTFGKAVQDLSTCTAYPLAVTGKGLSS